jgi:hypothetical protein
LLDMRIDLGKRLVGRHRGARIVQSFLEHPPLVGPPPRIILVNRRKDAVLLGFAERVGRSDGLGRGTSSSARSDPIPGGPRSMCLSNHAQFTGPGAGRQGDVRAYQNLVFGPRIVATGHAAAVGEGGRGGMIPLSPSKLRRREKVLIAGYGRRGVGSRPSPPARVPAAVADSEYIYAHLENLDDAT